MRLVLPFRLAPDTLAAPVSGPQHFLVNHPEKRKPVQVQRHRYKKQDVEGGVLSAALKLGNVNTRETSEISKFFCDSLASLRTRRSTVAIALFNPGRSSMPGDLAQT